jgi:hypothetical protein
MRLSFLLSQLAKTVLNLISYTIAGTSYSFGEDDGSIDPYIVFPLYQAVDRMIVTAPGGKPPVLGNSLTSVQESDADRATRRGRGGVGFRGWKVRVRVGDGFSLLCINTMLYL